MSIDRGFELEVSAKRIIYNEGMQPDFFQSYNVKILSEAAELADAYVKERKGIDASEARSRPDPLFDLALDQHNSFRALVGFGTLRILRRECPLPITESESTSLDLVSNVDVDVAFWIVERWYKEVKGRVPNPNIGNVFPGFNP